MHHIELNDYPNHQLIKTPQITQSAVRYWVFIVDKKHIVCDFEYVSYGEQSKWDCLDYKKYYKVKDILKGKYE